MRREQHGRAPAGLADEDLREGVDGDGVEARERLVEDQHVGLVEQGADQLHALLVAERKVFELVVDPIGEAELAEPAASASRSATLRSMPRSCAEEAQLLGDAHRRVQAALLGQVPEAAPHLEVDRLAVEAHAPGIEGGEPEHGPHGGGLAGAVRAEEPGDRTRFDRERHPVEGGDRTVVTDEAVDFQHAAPRYRGSSEPQPAPPADPCQDDLRDPPADRRCGPARSDPARRHPQGRRRAAAGAAAPRRPTGAATSSCSPSWR